jgi:predicted transposase/invertase (TIGR01784 family)
VFLKDQDGDLFYEKLNFKFLQMPLFKKMEDELEGHFDKWLYFLKNLESFNHIPAILNEPIFQKGFEIAEISHLTPLQHEQYQKSLVQYWEVKNVTDTAFKDGKTEGELEKAVKIARNMLAKGFDLETISELTGLSLSEIEKLANPLLNDEEK